MPIYEYRRQDGTTFDVVQKFSDEPLTVDPESGEPVQRVYRAPAIHFKGSGFHNTDYGSKRRPKAGTDDSGSGDKASRSSEESSGAGDGPAKPSDKAAGSDAAKSSDSTTAPKNDTSKPSSDTKSSAAA